MNNEAVQKIKNCPVCKREFLQYKTTQQVCTLDCALKYKAHKEAQKVKREQSKYKKNYLYEDTSHNKKAAQQAFNKWIVKVRDANDGCISCEKGPSWSGQWHCGHFKTVGARSDLRFDPRNAHKQCSVCNNHLSGNLAQYAERLKQKIGLEQFQDLDKVNIIKTNAEYYRSIANKYKRMLKEAGIK